MDSFAFQVAARGMESPTLVCSMLDTCLAHPCLFDTRIVSFPLKNISELTIPHGLLTLMIKFNMHGKLIHFVGKGLNIQISNCSSSPNDWLTTDSHFCVTYSKCYSSGSSNNYNDNNNNDDNNNNNHNHNSNNDSNNDSNNNASGKAIVIMWSNCVYRKDFVTWTYILWNNPVNCYCDNNNNNNNNTGKTNSRRRS